MQIVSELPETFFNAIGFTLPRLFPATLIELRKSASYEPVSKVSTQ